jgi:hypothetical protein
VIPLAKDMSLLDASAAHQRDPIEKVIDRKANVDSINE